MLVKTGSDPVILYMNFSRVMDLDIKSHPQEEISKWGHIHVSYLFDIL